MAFSETLVEHFQAPRNRCAMEGSDAEAEEENPVCGDRLHLWLRVRDGRIVAASWEGEGCAPAIAAASVLTELVTGMDLGEARDFGPDTLSQALGGLPPRKGHAATLAIDTLQQALQAYQDRGGRNT
ncbi:MAG TPA: iron-sulfur cluster assembly scaffold protein [Chloroflexota bacterium]|nr:iron-sulfur cluster assembly scaffold protein [Chloroflexota bacterium]